MYRTARISVYDCLDQVVVAAQVYEHGDAGWEPTGEAIRWYSTFPGKGTDDASIWLWEAVQQLQVQLDGQR
jgi:hypothetical protein